MNADEVLRVQRGLRHRLLDDKRVIRWSKARDLAAQLLVRLEDPVACWQFGTEWLQAEMQADRITAGPCDTRIPYYSPRFESLNPHKRVPSLIGIQFETAEKSMREILRARRVVVFRNLPVDVNPARSRTNTDRVAVKLGMAVRNERRATGMVCAHWLDREDPAEADTCNKLTSVVNEVFNPILFAAQHLAYEYGPYQATPPAASAVTPELTPERATWRALSILTPAELRLARLAATGMTYKEIAQQLNRSFSTVDHHLRNIREKFGVNSAAKLATMLAAEFHRLGN